MNIEGERIRLRAVEPEDVDLMYEWENDGAVWSVSGTLTPFSRRQMEIFVASQLDADILRAGQLRLVVETRGEGRPVGLVDLYDFDPLNRRAGVGILVHAAEDRGRGYASDAVAALCRYGAERLHLHQLWCETTTDNEPSLRLFRGAGFRDAGLRRDWLWDASGFKDVVLMQKMLDRDC